MLKTLAWRHKSKNSALRSRVRVQTLLSMQITHSSSIDSSSAPGADGTTEAGSGRLDGAETGGADGVTEEARG